MKKFIIYFFLVSIIASCKKDKVCNLDVGGFSGSYKISSVRDDLYTFNANGTYLIYRCGNSMRSTGH
ncbi:MAG: hypothetical protein IPI68_00875 [Chitinophagaceae bacterium]|nr:hypothetical protein [Chitinophagaceae bacterium]